MRLRRFFAFTASTGVEKQSARECVREIRRETKRERERERERERAQSASFGGRTFGVPRFVSGDPG